MFLGTQILIRTPSFSMDLEFLTVVTWSHTFGPIKYAISIPHFSVNDILWLHLD